MKRHNLKSHIMKTKVFLSMALMALSIITVISQETGKRFGFELSGGASFATRDPDDANLKTGMGFEGILHYRFMPYTGIYAGWGWNHFGSGNSFAGEDMDFEETGYVFGLQFKHPVGNSRISYYVRGAGLYNHIEIENSDGDIVEDSGHGFGWQTAAGIDIPLGSNWSLTPGLKFNSLNRKVDMEDMTHDLTLQYLAIRIGILKRF